MEPWVRIGYHGQQGTAPCGCYSNTTRSADQLPTLHTRDACATPPRAPHCRCCQWPTQGNRQKGPVSITHRLLHTLCGLVFSTVNKDMKEM